MVLQEYYTQDARFFHALILLSDLFSYRCWRSLEIRAMAGTEECTILVTLSGTRQRSRSSSKQSAVHHLLVILLLTIFHFRLVPMVSEVATSKSTCLVFRYPLQGSYLTIVLRLFIVAFCFPLQSNQGNVIVTSLDVRMANASHPALSVTEWQIV